MSSQGHQTNILLPDSPNHHAHMDDQPPVNLNLQIYPKATTPTNVYCREFTKLFEEQYPDSRHIYTDGSKTITGVGVAAVCEATSRSATLPQEASVFSAEVHALKLAISIIKADRLPNTLSSRTENALGQTLSWRMG